MPTEERVEGQASKSDSQPKAAAKPRQIKLQEMLCKTFVETVVGSKPAVDVGKAQAQAAQTLAREIGDPAASAPSSAPAAGVEHVEHVPQDKHAASQSADLSVEATVGYVTVSAEGAGLVSVEPLAPATASSPASRELGENEEEQAELGVRPLGEGLEPGEPKETPMAQALHACPDSDRAEPGELRQTPAPLHLT